MAKTNPCQVCSEVPAAEFTLAAAYPQASWFEQLVVNICEGCLLNAAYQRVQQLSDIAAREQGLAAPGALEAVEREEGLAGLDVVEVAAHPPKSKRPKSEEPVATVAPEAGATPD